MRTFLRRYLPASLRALVRSARTRLRSPEYDARVAAEASTFSDLENVHDLPPIFHYWSNRHLVPKLAPFGFRHPDAFFHMHVKASYERVQGGRRRFLSVGAGNCDTEIRLAAALLADGCRDFTIDCLDINASMLARGAADARQAGVGSNVIPMQIDLNRWQPQCSYDAVLANQSLHHVVALEHLFDEISTALSPDGRFIVSDIIGRNGHRRWPEARELVDEFWNELPAPYRFNRQLQRQESRFQDWDCSVSGFEGVRAQDILPELIRRFHFDLFIGFANIIDPFIDRSFGFNFDAEAEWDRSFIDRVHARDEAELAAGRIKPTHMYAVMRVGPGETEGVHVPGLSPRQSVRFLHRVDRSLTTRRQA